MSYSASPGGGYRIAIGGAIGLAYLSVFRNLRLAAAFAWFPLALILGVEAIALIFSGGGLAGRMLSSLTGMTGFFLFGTTFAVRWCRFILLGERQTGELFAPGWRPMIVVTAKICLILSAGAVAVVLIAHLAPQALKILIWAVGGLTFAFLSLRFLLALPAAAIERPLTLRAAWDLVRGNYWRFLACVLIWYLPVAVIEYLVGRAGATVSSAAWIGFEAVRLAVTFTGVAVLYAMLADVYRGITGLGTAEAAAD
jgi:hypothetical protein